MYLMYYLNENGERVYTLKVINLLKCTNIFKMYFVTLCKSIVYRKKCITFFSC